MSSIQRVMMCLAGKGTIKTGRTGAKANVSLAIRKTAHFRLCLTCVSYVSLVSRKTVRFRLPIIIIIITIIIIISIMMIIARRKRQWDRDLAPSHDDSWMTQTLPVETRK